MSIPFDPDWRVPPRETLLEVLTERKIARGDLALGDDLSAQLEQVLHHDGVLTPELASGLEATLGITAQFWLNLEAEYRRPLTTTDVAIPEEIVNPFSGELVPTGDLERVGTTIDDLRTLKRQVEQAIAAFSEVVIAESRRQGTKTLTAGGVEMKVSADSEIQWDFDVLLELRDLGLPEARYDELVTAKVEFKVNGSVARQVAGARPEYAEVIERAKIRLPKRQYVTPTRRPPLPTS